MGAGTRKAEIRIRRKRREKRRHRRLLELRKALARGRNRQERLRIAQEVLPKLGGTAF
jgi:hypothetical protein